MPPIVIYTKSTCSYCHAAKSLLRSKSAPFEEIGSTATAPGRRRWRQKAGGRWTVPQIFIGDRHVGGCDDLHELEAAGELDRLLAG